MAEMNDIVKVAVDAYHGNVESYSVDQSMELLRKALIDANGGDTKLNYKNIRDGKCTGLFALVEEILARTVAEGWAADPFFEAMVDYRNVALGHYFYPCIQKSSAHSFPFFACPKNETLFIL